MSTHFESTGKRKKGAIDKLFESVEDIGTRIRKAVIPDEMQSDAVKVIDDQDEKRRRRKK